MFLPCVIDLCFDPVSGDWMNFFVNGLFLIFLGGTVALAWRPPRQNSHLNLTMRDVLFLTTSVWIVIPVCSGLPMIQHSHGMDSINAFFEATSCLTTTGSSTISTPEKYSTGFLFWRSFLQLIGGVGIIVFTMIIMPFLKVGGMQLFRSESSDRSEKVFPRASQLAVAILKIYVFMLTTCMIGLLILGVPAFDAFCLSISAVSTSGMTNYQEGLYHFKDVSVEWILGLGMLLGGSPFIFYLHLIQKRYNTWNKIDSQVRFYLEYTVIVIGILFLWLYGVYQHELGVSFKTAFFHAISIITTTGFVGEDIHFWGPFPIIIFFVISFIGGCSGSTAGGVKVVRAQIILSLMANQIKQMINPKGVYVTVYNNRPLEPSVMISMLNFLVFWLLTMGFLALCLSCCGLDLAQSLSTAWGSISNLGPVFESTHTDLDYNSMLPSVKIIMMVGMILGRLELLTVFVVLTRTFWRG